MDYIITKDEMCCSAIVVLIVNLYIFLNISSQTILMNISEINKNSKIKLYGSQVFQKLKYTYKIIGQEQNVCHLFQ